MNNETDIGIKFSASVNGNKKLQELATSLSMIKGVADGLNTGAINSIEVGSNEMKEISKNTKTTANVMKLAFNFSTVRMFARTLGNVTKELTRLATKSSEYLENVNLFQVAFDGNYRSAERFINKVSEMYGLDESRLTRVVGIFKQLSNAMNVSAETGEKLATLMTQMSLDISSLYNVDFERATSVLQSALSGQTKPIRGTTGADITQATLQTTLDSLGIDRAVNQLTFAEKRLLIIISLTQQLKEATNDLGRTIESPANQLKVLSEQWQRLSRALGNTFLPILAKILPYLNAIMMVLTEIINMIAKLFGYKEEDYDYFSGTDEAVQNLEDSLAGATAGVGKLKKALTGLRSFDKLNVISTPASGGAGGGSGAGLGGNIDPSILKAFNEAFDSYNKKLSDVQMKATKIRDSIMEWLGFTKEIDPLTGKVQWKYKGLGATLKNILKWLLDFKSPLAIVTKALAWVIGSKVYSGFKKLFDLLSRTAIGKKIVNLISPLKTLSSLIKMDLAGGFKGLGTSIKESMTLWSQSLTTIDKVKVGLVGSAGLYAGLKLVQSGMKDIAVEGEITAGSLLKSIGGVSANILSMSTMLGAQFGPGGFLVGAIGGAITGVLEAWNTYSTYANTNLAEIEEHGKEIDAQYEKLKESQKYLNEQYQVASGHTEYYQSLYAELESIVDENGKIKQGYEDRAQVITNELSQALGTEIKIVDGVVTKYRGLKDEIQKLIKKKEAMAKLNALESAHTEAIENIKKAREDESVAYDDLREAQEKQFKQAEHWADKIQDITAEQLVAYANGTKTATEIAQELHDTYGTNVDAVTLQVETLDKYTGYFSKYTKAVEKAEKNYDKASETLQGYTKTINDWSVMTGYAYDENYDAMNYYFDHEMNLYGLSKKKQKEYWEGNISDNKRYLEDLERNRDNYSKATYEALKKQYEDEIALSNSKLDELKYQMIKKVEDIDDDVVQHFWDMGVKSTDDFVTAMEQLPRDVQDKIISEMEKQGKKIPEELQKGIDQVKLSKEIEVTAKDDKAKQTINNLIGKTATAFSNMGLKVNPIKLASGGMPPAGQLFVANERGPELVGQIGGQSFVANQNQMMDLLDRKIGNVQGNNRSNDVYNIYLDANHKIGSYTLEQLQGMAKTNGKPISIG